MAETTVEVVATVAGESVAAPPASPSPGPAPAVVAVVTPAPSPDPVAQAQVQELAADAAEARRVEQERRDQEVTAAQEVAAAAAARADLALTRLDALETRLEPPPVESVLGVEIDTRPAPQTVEALPPASEPAPARPRGLFASLFLG